MNIHDITKQIRAFADQLESTQTPAPFQLPPPPPGMQWHRTDGWKSEDLPHGTRPLCFDEPNDCRTDEYSFGTGDGWDAQLCRQPKPQHSNGYWRTTRPLVFTHEGKQWTYHRPGDPMPCDGERRVFIVGIDGKTVACDGFPLVERSARSNRWDQTLGWRYAEPLTREVELGPEDCPPGSVFRNTKFSSPWVTPSFCDSFGITFLAGQVGDDGKRSWSYAKQFMEINRPRHRDADGNPTLWEKCSKTVTVEQL